MHKKDFNCYKKTVSTNNVRYLITSILLHPFHSLLLQLSSLITQLKVCICTLLQKSILLQQLQRYLYFEE